MPAAREVFTGGRFALTVDGEVWGFPRRLTGGNIKAEVATHPLGRDNIQRKKNVAGIVHEPFVMDVGLDMSKALYDWIGISFDSGLVRRTGEFVACDFDSRAVSVREFREGLITEVTIPALDGSSKDPAYLTIEIDPGEISYQPGNGSLVQSKVTRSQKWPAANFLFELGTLPCSRVTKIDSFTWKQSVVDSTVGSFRYAGEGVAKVEVPNLEVTISMADVGPWQDWHRSFLIEGNCTDADELNGAITFLAPDLLEELARIELVHVGLVSLDTIGWSAKEEIARFTVELYVEQMRFDYLAPR